MRPEAPQALPAGEPDAIVAYQRQALLGTAAAVVAHEFNNLMTPVLARAEYALLRNEVAEMRRALACVVEQTQRAIEVTRLLLEMAEGRSPAPQPCDVAVVVDEAVGTLVRPFEKDGIRLEVEIPERVEVQADPVLLRQVLANLLLNARQAIGRGSGRITVRARRDGAEGRIEISDTGCGMSPEHIDRVINPFLSADPSFDTTDWHRVGLGLHACRLIAHQFGARLRAEANAGGGCTFTLRWPLA